ncbi:MAG: 6,7-dimethyl-8-ribityllumazine synthase [Thalassobaculum sp.]|uniref:6,7-dimethyl-8-ribityllumazine synthase n=1 Tax=Thalassobaculum sp. TaxID=2022740 RepID=UPI0032EBBA8B
MNQSLTENTNTDPGAGRIAFVRAGWHEDLLEHAWRAFGETMAQGGWPSHMIDLVRVPGAFEIPLRCRLLADSGRYRAVVASALVVDGGIYRHEFVAGAVINGLMTVQLETRVPVLSAVLTPHHFHEHAEHHGFFAGHMAVKGEEVARACLAVLEPEPSVRAA